eukprot:1699836-Pyramimonas_sp.AAC.1
MARAAVYISMTFRIQSKQNHKSELSMGPRANVVSTDIVLQTAGGPPKIWSLVSHAWLKVYRLRVHCPSRSLHGRRSSSREGAALLL